MRPNLLILAATCAITLLPALAASGAVDPGVSDRGPHSASLRALGQGNGQFSIRQDITQRVPWLAVQPGRVDPQTGLVLPQPFEISIPGVHAYVQRPTYLVRAPDGNLSPNLPPGQSNNYFQLPGPNTVYSLIPPPTPTPTPPPNLSCHRPPRHPASGATPASPPAFPLVWANYSLRAFPPKSAAASTGK